MTNINDGKKFEIDFKNSVPEGIYYYRFCDGTASWGGNDNTRFQAKNICDCMIYNGTLFLLELKSHTGKSIPLSVIRQNQIDELGKASTYEKIVAGFIFNFRDISQTYFVKANLVANFIFVGERKSIPLSWCQENGIELKGRLLITHYRWDLSELLRKED